MSLPTVHQPPDHDQLKDLQERVHSANLFEGRKQARRRLRFALLITFVIFLAELFGGILSNSLALMADAVHMLTDLGALGLSSLAMWIAQRPATDTRTYGYYRIETIAALLNGTLLWTIVLGILYEAWKRIHQPPEIHVTWLLTTASIGLAANLLAGATLFRSRDVSLNLRSAFLHVVSDTLGSLAALTAGVSIALGGLVWMDAAMSLVVAGLILVSSIGIIREAFRILMEGTPTHIDLDDVRNALLEIPGILDVHDLHIWTVTSGVEAMSGHAIIDDLSRTHDILIDARKLLHERFRIHHVTLQLECCDLSATEPHI